MGEPEELQDKPPSNRVGLIRIVFPVSVVYVCKLNDTGEVQKLYIYFLFLVLFDFIRATVATMKINIVEGRAFYHAYVF